MIGFHIALIVCFTVTECYIVMLYCDVLYITSWLIFQVMSWSLVIVFYIVWSTIFPEMLLISQCHRMSSCEL